MATQTTRPSTLTARVGKAMFGSSWRIAGTIMAAILLVFAFVTLYAVFGLPVFNGQTAWQLQYKPALDNWFNSKQQPALVYANAHGIDTTEVNMAEASRITQIYILESAFNKAKIIVMNIATNGVRPANIINSVFTAAGIPDRISPFWAGVFCLIALLVTLNGLSKRLYRNHIARKVNKMIKK